MRDIDVILNKAIQQALISLEERGDIVLTTPVISEVSKPICEHVMSAYAGGVLSPDEVLGLVSLILHATSNEKFYDWEIPTLIGYTKAEMSELGEKLRATINI